MEINNTDEASTDGQTPQPAPDYKRFAPPGNKKKGRKWAIVLLIIVLLAAVGVAAYGLGRSKSGTNKSANSSGRTDKKPKAAASSTSGTTSYTAKGQDINLSFEYPIDWAATPANGTDNDDKPITVTSQLVSLTDANGETVTGKIVVNIRPGNANPGELNSNNPVAAQNSSQFAYKAPTPSQHQYPFLSYVHFSNGSKAPGAFEEVIVTGIESFSKGQQIGTIASDPIISASFYKCTTQACSGAGQQLLSLTDQVWQNSVPTKQVQDLLSSLKLN